MSSLVVAVRRSTKICVSLALVSSLVTACGGDDRSKEGGKVWNPELPNGRNTKAGSYVMADPSCLQDAPLNLVSSAQVFSLYGSASNATLQSNFGSISSVPSLRGPSIRGTSFGLRTETTCTRDGDSSSCSSRPSLAREATPLKICRDRTSYPRESLEAVGLTGLSYLESTLDFYAGLPLDNRKNIKVDLQLMPEFVSKYPSSSKTKTDNLSYYGSLLGQPTIVIFAMTNLGRQLWPNGNLWESDWIVAHEAAHAIFDKEVSGGRGSILADAIRDRATPVVELDEEEGEARVEVEHLSATVAQRKVTLDVVVSAVNEAAADYIAAKKTPKSNLETNGERGLNCFKHSRNIYSPVFADGQRKQLSQGVLSRFFANQVMSREVQSDQAACNTPNFQDVHAIGAIVAHGVERIFAPLTSSPAEQAALAVRWIRAMNSTVSSPDGSVKTLMQLVEAAVKTGARGGRMLTSEQCRAINEVFPVFATSWIGTNGKYSCS